MFTKKHLNSYLMRLYLHSKNIGWAYFVSIFVFLFIIPVLNYLQFSYSGISYELRANIIRNAQLLIPFFSVLNVVFMFRETIEADGAEIFLMPNKNIKIIDFLGVSGINLLIITLLFTMYSSLFADMWFEYFRILIICFVFFCIAYGITHLAKSITPTILILLSYLLITVIFVRYDPVFFLFFTMEKMSWNLFFSHYLILLLFSLIIFGLGHYSVKRYIFKKFIFNLLQCTQLTEFQRAKITIIRQFGMVTAFFFIILVLSTIISGALIVRDAVHLLDENARRNMRPLVTFRIDGEKSNAFFDEFGYSPLEGFLTSDIVHDISSLPYVNDYVYFIETGGMSYELMQYWYGVSRHDRYMESYYIPLFGTSTRELIQVSQGLIELTQGRTFTDEEMNYVQEQSPVIISERFAYLNDLYLDSIFTLEIEISEIDPNANILDVNWIPQEMPIIAHEHFDFKVIGIFDIAEEENFENYALHDEEIQMLLSRERERISRLSAMLHVPNIAAQRMQDFHSYYMTKALHAFPESLRIRNQDGFTNRVSAMFLLNDPLEMKLFEDAASEFLPSDFWQIDYLTSDFDHVATTMQTLNDISNWILWGAIISMVIIACLLMNLFVLGKKTEIGIYLALGERKIKIIIQFLTEVLLTTFIATSIALILGNIISNSFSRNLLRDEVLSIRERGLGNTLLRMGFMQSAPDIYPAELVEIFDLSLSFLTIIIFYMVYLGIVILSLIIPLHFTIRANPKKLLK